MIAEDMVGHFEIRAEAMGDKDMFVCMGRRNGVDLYNQIVALQQDPSLAPGREVSARRTADVLSTRSAAALTGDCE